MTAGISTPRWTRLAAFGFTLTTAALLLDLIAAVIWRLEGAVFLIPFTLVAGITAFLVRRFGTWSKILGIVVGILLALGLFWTAFGIFSINSFFDYTPSLGVVPGALIGIGASIGAIVAKRRGHFTEAAEGAERTAIRVPLMIIGGLAALSLILTIATRSTVPDGSTAAATVRAKNFKFDPTTHSVKGGSSILIKNDDPFIHTFTVDALDIDVSLTPFSSKLIEIPATPGTYVLYCRPHGDPAPDAQTSSDSMNATLTVS